MASRIAFALVHGAGHGAWCWERVALVLGSSGHLAVAVDLPCEDPTAGARAYAEVVLDSLAHVHEEVVLVGHSLAGLTIPLVAAARPTRAMVFVAGVLPVPGMSLTRQKELEPEMVFPRLDESFRSRYYGEANDADAEWALGRLRPQAELPYDEITPLGSWPDTPSTVIVSDRDRVVNPEWAIRASRERLGVKPLVLAGADHCPFVARPEQLAGLLINSST